MSVPAAPMQVSKWAGEHFVVTATSDNGVVAARRVGVTEEPQIVSGDLVVAIAGAEGGVQDAVGVVAGKREIQLDKPTAGGPGCHQLAVGLQHQLYEVQVVAAVDKALAALRGRYHFITAVAELVDGTTPPPAGVPYRVRRPVTDHDGSALVDRLDAALGEENDEYLTKRRSLRYGAPSSG
jgi:hypothetical protein